MTINAEEILVIVDAFEPVEPRPATLRLLAFAKDLSTRVAVPFSIVVLGAGAVKYAHALSQVGAGRIIVHTPPSPAEPLPEEIIPSLAQLVVACRCRWVVGAANAIGRDWMPRLAGQLDAAYLGDCVGVDVLGSELSFLRPINAGNILAHCQILENRAVLTVRPTEFPPLEPDPSLAASPTEPLPPCNPGSSAQRVRWLAHEAALDTRPDLGEARVVVSGGRALSGRFFDVLGPLADALGAALGATRAACDAGYAPSTFQVGQTGRVVAPELYVAVGISGAIQHTAGMRGARTIVAINSDPTAPIFDMADYALVGDLFEVVPELVGALDAHRKSTA